jgi:hypothetical protein
MDLVRLSVQITPKERDDLKYALAKNRNSMPMMKFLKLQIRKEIAKCKKVIV